MIIPAHFGVHRGVAVYIRLIRKIAHYKQTYTFTNSTAYSYYKWDITANGGGSIIQASEFTFSNTSATVTARGDNSYWNEGIDKLTDGNLSTKWLDLSATSWVLFTYTSAQTWNKYAVTSGNDEPLRDPKAWTLQGSNNGTQWTLLDTRTGQTWSARNKTQTYTFTNSTAYRYYKWVITENGGSGCSIIQASEFSFGNSNYKSNETSNIINSNENTQEQFVSIYPNPATDFVNIELNNTSGNEKTSISIVDLSGKIVYNEETVDVSHLIIATNSFGKGMYIVNIKNDSKIVNTKLIVK